MPGSSGSRHRQFRIGDVRRLGLGAANREGKQDEDRDGCAEGHGLTLDPELARPSLRAPSDEGQRNCPSVALDIGSSGHRGHAGRPNHRWPTRPAQFARWAVTGGSSRRATTQQTRRTVRLRGATSVCVPCLGPRVTTLRRERPRRVCPRGYVLGPREINSAGYA